MLNVSQIPPKGTGTLDFSFTADGKKMLYTEFQSNRKTALIIRNLENKSDRIVLQSAYERDEIFKPFIHPNGDEVVFLKNMANDSTYVFDIFTLDVAKGTVKNLIQTPDISERMPNWSDDGNYLIWSSNRNKSSFDLFKLNRTTQVEEQISFFEDRQELNAHLSNSILVFDSGFYGMNEEGNTYIYKAGTEEKTPEQLTKISY
ncbi:TolB family protein [Flagellimonas sp.]|uniref:TolB family protein n=1 Tax=Flagellimonas sp. TaxID=2058762 RepID=UPI0026879F38